MKQTLASILLAFLVFAPHTVGAQVVLSGTADINTGVFLNTEKLAESTLDQRLVLSPGLSAWTDFFDFSFSGSISAKRPGNELDFEVNELLVTLYPFDFMQIKAGRFSHLPGTAEFLSSTNYFSRTDYEKLITGTVDATSVPNDLLQVGFFLSDYYLKLTAAPFRADMVLPEVTSPWFPGKDIPTEVVTTVVFSNVTLQLDRLYYVEPEPTEYTLEEVSFSPEIGATLAGVDISLSYYRGYDNTPLTQAKFITPEGVYESAPYNIELKPYYSWKDAIGANVATSLSSLRLWTDASYTFEKAMLTNRVSFTSRTTQVVTYPYFEYTFGASYEIYDPAIFALLEIRNSHIIGGGDYLVKPILGSALTAGLNFSYFDSRLSSNLFFLLSFADQSNALVMRLSYDPTDHLAVLFTFPIFSGQPDSELGQFADNKYLSLNLEWRY